jgi:hypothetical protein
LAICESGEIHLERLSLHFLAPHLWFWVLLLAPALAVAFWAYYRVLAPLERPARRVLWTLRGLAFLLVLFALWQPVLTAVTHDTGHPGLAILVDRSGSMSLPAGGPTPGPSRAKLAQATAEKLSARLGDRFRLDWYGFDAALHSGRPDPAQPPAGPTALGTALEQALTRADARPVSGVVLVTDGVSTSGRDPVRVAAASAVPVFAVVVGASRPLTDAEVRSVRTNPTAFAGEPSPVRVVVSSTGLGGTVARLDVREGDRVLATREVTLLGGQGIEQEVPLDVRLTAPGTALLDVSLQAERDSIPRNNRRRVAIEVQARKTRVLVLSGRLDWDYAFLRRTLAADTTLSYTFLVQERPGDYRVQGDPVLRRPPATAADLRDFAAVVLLGYDEVGAPAEVNEAIARFVRAGGGLFLLGGPARPGGWASTGPLAGVLPGSVDRDPFPQSRELPVAVTLDGQRHPATAVSDNPAETARRWAALPPLARTGGGLAPAAESRVLLEYRGPRGAAAPALVASFAGQGKAAWLYGRGAWRWGFLPAGAPNPDDLYAQFLLGLVRWLAEPAVRERFQVDPGKRVYQDGEPVRFTAGLWNEAYALVSGARVRVEVRPDSGGGPPTLIDLPAAAEPGRYEGGDAPFAPGAWSWEGVAADPTGGRELARAHGRFWVEPMGPEFARTVPDREALAQIAARSGGALFEADGVDALADAIPRAIRRVGRVREWDVWNHWLLLVSFVVVLSAEWFLRRRRGLA